MRTGDRGLRRKAKAEGKKTRIKIWWVQKIYGRYENIIESGCLNCKQRMHSSDLIIGEYIGQPFG
jgi:hypothetical protein